MRKTKSFLSSNEQKISRLNRKMCIKLQKTLCKLEQSKYERFFSENLRSSEADCESGWNVRWNAWKLQRDARKFKQLSRALKRRKIRELWLLLVFFPTTTLLHGHHQLCYLETIFCFLSSLAVSLVEMLRVPLNR